MLEVTEVICTVCIEFAVWHELGYDLVCVLTIVISKTTVHQIMFADNSLPTMVVLTMFPRLSTLLDESVQPRPILNLYCMLEPFIHGVKDKLL